jgi:hypothetical protein
VAIQEAAIWSGGNVQDKIHLVICALSRSPFHDPLYSTDILGSGVMSKFAKGKSWIEHRLADTLDVNGSSYTVNLVARKGTGVQGFRVTLDYIPHETGGTIEVEMPNAATTADVHRLSRELSEQPDELRRLCREVAGS